MKKINVDDFIAYVQKFHGKTLKTKSQKKPFRFNLLIDGFEYIPLEQNSRSRTHKFVAIKRYLESVDVSSALADKTYLRVLVDKFVLANEELLTSPPSGSTKPKKTLRIVDSYSRDIKVKNWVKNKAAGQCESCDERATFIDKNNEPFLEVHHVKRLADGGSDKVTNAIAICPNCHREFHEGIDKNKKIEEIYKKVSRLVRE